MSHIASSVIKHLVLVVCIIVATTQLQIHALAQGVEAETEFEITIEYEIPENINTSFKALMDYRCITDTSTPQYTIRELSYTDKQGFRRINDDYIVALGTYYADQAGDRFIIMLEDGTEFTVTVGDIKNNKHTDRSNRYYPMDDNNGNLIEFVVDTDVMDDYILFTLGDVSSLGFEGQIKKIKKIIQI